MKLIDRMKNTKTVLQFFKFSIVGLSNTFVSLAIYYIFLWVNKDFYLIGNIVGWTISVINAFYWNNKYVFENSLNGFLQTIRKIGKTYLSYGATFVLSTILLYFEVDLWRWSSVISPVINLLITIPLNFLLNKFWAFH